MATKFQISAGAVVGLLLAAAVAAAPASAQQVGVYGAVNPEASGTPPGATARRLVLGQDVVFNERITTGDVGQTQIIFVDGSTMSIGPNSDLVIDQFVYDPNTSTGRLAMSSTRGVFRYVGGRLSKNEGAVSLQTPTATLAIRGGVFIARVQ